MLLTVRLDESAPTEKVVHSGNPVSTTCIGTVIETIDTANGEIVIDNNVNEESVLDNSNAYLVNEEPVVVVNRREDQDSRDAIASHPKPLDITGDIVHKQGVL